MHWCPDKISDYTVAKYGIGRRPKVYLTVTEPEGGKQIMMVHRKLHRMRRKGGFIQRYVDDGR